MQEIITVVFENQKVRIERIESFSAASQPDFWYDSPLGEYVSVVRGSARLQFFDNTFLELKAGEGVFIEPHKKHRVDATSLDCEWFCVYIK